MSVFSIECIFLFFSFILELIFIVDKFYIFSNSGSKLEIFLKKENQPKLAHNFELERNNNNFFQKIKSTSPDFFCYVIKNVLISIAILMIKMCITVKYTLSNFLYIKLFKKNICLNILLFSNKYIFAIIYYFISEYFILKIIFKIFKYSKKIEEKENTEEDRIFLAKDNYGIKKYITFKGLYQNVFITGSIGSGKTSSAISILLEGLIKKGICGLIIDVKGSYIENIKKILKKYNKENSLIEISLNNNFKYNPINKKNLSSFEISNYIIRVLKVLANGNNHSDPFWLDKSQMYISNFITIIRAYNNGNVNFYEIHKLVTNNDYLSEKLEIIKKDILNNKYNDEKLFELNNAISNIKNEYLKLDTRVLSIIKSEITRVTNIFVTNYYLYEKFCTSNTELDFLGDKIVVLSFPIGENKALSKIISTYIKLDFEQSILSRKKKDKPVFFICDEFQEIVNYEDSDFFSISREYKCINIISAQSYYSIINSVGNEKAANVIIQNLVNKIWFRNDDMYTVKEIIKQIGKEEKRVDSLSYTESGQNSRYSIINKSFKDYKTGISKSFSVNKKIEYKIDESDITLKLKTFEAICFLSDGYRVEVINKLKFKRWDEVYEEKANK